MFFVKEIVDLEETIMKTRILSAIVALAIFIPIFLVGGTIYHLAIFVLSMQGLREFLNMMETKKEIPLFIKIVSYLFMALFILGTTSVENITFGIDLRLISGIFLVYLLPVVLYHDSKKYTVVDAFEIIGSLLFLGLAFKLLIVIRNMSLSLIVFLFLISIFTDTFALVTGMFIGKHKLLEVISPKKTIEGMIGGTLMGVFVSSIFYITVVNPSVDIFALLVTTLFLSILGQFGDLFFSAIKRHYKKKDFSNIMPGHGGVLDRLDSILFIALGFVFFINII